MKLLLDVYLPSSHLYISVLVFLLIYLFLKLLHVVQLKEKMCYVSSVNAFYPPFFGLKESVFVFKDGGLDIIEKHDFGHSYSRKIWQPWGMKYMQAISYFPKVNIGASLMLS